MFFTKIGLVLAWLLVVVGGLSVVMAFSLVGANDPAVVSRYLGTHTTGEAIDRGLLWLLIGVAVGMVAEISRSVAAKSEANRQKSS